MKVKQLFALTALALAGGAALADEAPGTPLTRAEVVQSVLAARAAGTLIPAGEVDLVYPQVAATPSNVTRAQVQSQVRQARADGTLIVSGEGDPGYPKAADNSSTLTRAQVKAEVLQARANGELMPAGEAESYGAYPITRTTHTVARSSQIGSRTN